MASKDLTTVLLVILVLCFFSCDQYGVGGTSLSKEEDLELEQQLKILNKPPVKTIQTGEGDIFDCVDIYKQPAFDHPLLKNHKIQMRPSNFPRQEVVKSSSTPKPMKFGLQEFGGCPSGTVPIRRVQKEDLIRAKSLSRRYATKSQPLTLSSPGHHFAKFRVISDSYTKYYGGQANIIIQNPSVTLEQFSEASIWIQNSNISQLNSIQVGWTVNPTLFGDNSTRIFSYWTTDGGQDTGCFNLLCSGFVQVDRNVTFGERLTAISHYGGDQYEIKFLIYKDNETGNWWFVFSDDKIFIGYWPKFIFTNLAEFASEVHFGGEVYSPSNEASPPMGSGHFPNGLNFKEASFFRCVQVVDPSNKVVDPDVLLIDTWMDSPSCYNVEPFFKSSNYFRHSFLYGGPGGNCGN